MPVYVSPADIATGLLSVCGGLIWLGFLAVGGAAIWQAIEHRRIHRRLHLAWGYSGQCPVCIRDEEVKTLPWHVRFSRDVRRKQITKEEFRD